MTASSSFRLIALALVAGCAHSGAVSSTAPSSAASASSVSATAAAGALAPLASQPLIVLPTQSLELTVPDWSAKVGDPRTYLAGVDDEIAFAVKERGLRGTWAFPADLARSARRNPGYAADPYTIALDPLAAVERDPDKLLAEPLAGQLRGLAGLSNARYALVPVKLRLAPAGSGARASVHLVVIDTRQAKLTWKGDVTSDVVQTFSPAIAAGLAGRVADLFTTAR